MHIIEKIYITGSLLKNKQVIIPELNRFKPSTPQFQEMANLLIRLTRPTAFIYVDGTSISQSEAGLSKGTEQYVPAIKGSSSYIAHQWCSEFENKEHLKSIEVVAGTCASGILALKRADELILSGKVEEVIIIGQERTTPDTVRLFRELGIDVTCGDGFVYMRLEAGFDITRIQWKWAYNNNPFTFTKTDLDTLIPAYRIGYVKLHGTGTETNTAAEAGLAQLATPLLYKPQIGHTQGISSLLETCLVLDDKNIRGRILVTANGLGGYYGAFTLTKPNART
jgi:hypothetical protein